MTMEEDYKLQSAKEQKDTMAKVTERFGKLRNKFRETLLPENTFDKKLATFKTNQKQ